MSERENISKKLFRIKSESIIDFLENKIDLENFKAIEIFGGEGVNDSIFSKYAKYFEIWEIDSSLESELNKNVPNAKIKFCDSIKTLNENNDFGFFDLILIDNPMSVFGEKLEYCEHFDVIKNIEKLIDKEAIVIFLVNKKPFFSKKLKKKNILWRKRRQEFYGKVDTNNMSIQFLSSFYTELFRSIGLNTIFSNIIPRHSPHLDYFIFMLRKNKNQHKNSLKTLDWISLAPLFPRNQ